MTNDHDSATHTILSAPLNAQAKDKTSVALVDIYIVLILCDAFDAVTEQ